MQTPDNQIYIQYSCGVSALWQPVRRWLLVPPEGETVRLNSVHCAVVVRMEEMHAGLEILGLNPLGGLVCCLHDFLF